MKTKQRGTTHLPSTHGWHVEKVRIYGDYSVQDRSNVVIADAIPLENLANIIAAAPEMLEALKGLLEAVEDETPDTLIVQTGSHDAAINARRAITRATGRERG